MGSIIIRRGMKIVRTPEQVAEQELARMKPARLREKNFKKVAS